MNSKKEFDYKRSQIEKYLKAEFQKKFRTKARISIRKRQKFMSDMTRKVGKKFGKDVLFLVDFSKQGFVTLVSPSKVESTDKGRLYQSFAHPQVFYTSHSVDRFSERTDTTENCIIALDSYMEEALLSFGENEGFLTGTHGVFAYEIETDRLVIKTYIPTEMLSEDQVRQFYGPGAIAALTRDFLAEEVEESDFIIADEISPAAGNKPRN
jgi:hypothetical protein